MPTHTAQRRGPAMALVLMAAAMSLPLLVDPLHASAAAAPKNLIKDAGADAVTGASDESTVVRPPQWKVPKGEDLTALQYGTSGGFPTSTDPGPSDRGANLFAGGPPPSSGSATATATQSISLSSYKKVIAAGATYTLAGWLGGYADQEDAAVLSVEWTNKAKADLGSASIGPVTAQDRNDVTGLFQVSTSAAVPAGATKAVVTLTLTRAEGSYNDGYADSLSLTIGASAG